MKTTKTIWILLAAGNILFAACQSNNTPASGRADTTNSMTLNGGTPQNQATVAPTPPAEPAAATTSSTLMDTTGMVCVPRRRPHPATAARTTTSHRVAYYNRHKRHRKNAEATITETSVATTEPAPTPPQEAIAAPETQPITTAPSAPITYEKPDVFTGNMQATAPAKRAKVHLAPEAGGNINNLYMRSEDYQGSNEVKTGFNAGVMVNIEMGNRFAFEPGVRYIMKGGELTSTSTDGLITTEDKEKLTFHYVEMPLNFVYNTGDWGTNHFMIGAGPYASYLVNAQDKTKDKSTGPDGTVITTGQHSVPVGDPTEAGHLRSYDVGAGAFIGYQMRSGVYVKGGAEMGFIDLERNPNTLNQFNNRNYNFLLDIGYMCGYRK